MKKIEIKSNSLKFELYDGTVFKDKTVLRITNSQNDIKTVEIDTRYLSNIVKMLNIHFNLRYSICKPSKQVSELSDFYFKVDNDYFEIDYLDKDKTLKITIYEFVEANQPDMKNEIYVFGNQLQAFLEVINDINDILIDRRLTDG